MTELVDRDKEHLGILSIIYYVFAGLSSLTALFAIFYVFIGIFFASIDLPKRGLNTEELPQEVIGSIFIIIGTIALLAGLGWALLQFLCARWLKIGRNHTFCMVIAIINLPFMPLGTILGIFTLIVLNRPSVKLLFNNEETEGLPAVE